MNRWARARRVYRSIWSVATGTVIALGLAASFRDPGPLSAIALFLAAATMGVVCTITVASLMTPDAVTVRRTTVGGLVTGVLTLALVGLAMPSGPAAFWVIMVLGLAWPGWPGLVRRVRRATQGEPAAPAPGRETGPRRAPETARGTKPRSEPGKASGSRARPRSGQPPARPPAWEPTPVVDEVTLEVPDMLEDADLCLAWCSSYVALQRAETAESRMRLVLVRALYLDELERRNPAALAEWLSSGARAAAPPHAFVRREDDRSAAS